MKHKLLHGLLLTATLVITGCNAVSSAAKPESLMKTESAFTVEETANKLNAIIQSKGLTVFTRINHAENAAKAGLDLRPTELIIFGNPKVGTPLMQCAQTTAIDLPQKMLVWQDEEKKVWVSYNTPEYLKQRHNIEGCDKVLGKVKNVLGTLSKAATSK